MTSLPFIKMHGAGNDYVFVDGFETPLPTNPYELAVHVSNRHFAVGSDGLVFLKPPPDADSDVHMRMWNSDGSEGLMCGNAARCVALWMHRKKRIKKVCRIKTAAGIVQATILESDRSRNRATVAVDLQDA
jgi:diaminopimelate epimerase